ncbi:YdcF family protein [Piscinibacter sp.]|uniref:YdcF family protein n=1 Tax=Piscinibacter sp. TaxID=1903157 RepID=UPI0039E2F99C
MNDLLTLLGLAAWKPQIGALLLPPVPFIVLMLVGTRVAFARRGWGWLLVASGAALLWLSSTMGFARVLSDYVLRPPAAFSSERAEAWRAAVKAREPVAILVLGGGGRPFAPEYGVSNLTPNSVERLRYGVWLSRETGAPLGYSGGVGWALGSSVTTPEAQIAARIAQQEFGRPLKWAEERSRDTRENAIYSVALLKEQGIRRVLLVSHQRHLPRALRAFQEVGADSGIVFETAPVDVMNTMLNTPMAWLPTTRGMQTVREITHELMGRWFGA